MPDGSYAWNAPIVSYTFSILVLIAALGGEPDGDRIEWFWVEPLSGSFIK